MARPKEHGEHIAAALLEAAEQIVEADGLDALTVRRIAKEVGTTTRAVYSVFGSKDGLVVALGGRAFDLLREHIEALPATPDPAADLVEAGVSVFRLFAIEHPSLFKIGVQRALPAPGLFAGFRASAERALAELEALVGRLAAAGGICDRTVRDAARGFHSLCEGLAAMELRGALPVGDEVRIWRDALTALVQGFALPSPAGR